MMVSAPSGGKQLAGLIAVIALVFAPSSISFAAPLGPAGPSTAVRQAAPDPSIPNNPGYPNDPNYSTVPFDPDVSASMDTAVTSADISDLPLSVQPGQAFTIGIDAAPGAHCAGTITFRGPPPIELTDVAANGEVCSWSITAPVTARQGTAIIDTQVTKNGQSWRVAGVVYVNPPGESR